MRWCASSSSWPGASQLPLGNLLFSNEELANKIRVATLHSSEAGHPFRNISATSSPVFRVSRSPVPRFATTALSPAWSTARGSYGLRVVSRRRRTPNHVPKFCASCVHRSLRTQTCPSSYLSADSLLPSCALHLWIMVSKRLTAQA